MLGPSRPGCKFAYVGDASRTDDLVDPIRGAQALAIESTYTSLEADAAREYGHLTARQAAELAVAAKVETLILYHLSRRYGEREILDEARPIFANTVVARDLDHFQIRRDAPLVQVERDK